MGTETTHKATCDSCGGKEEFSSVSYNAGLPPDWVCARLRGSKGNGGRVVYALDLCETCQVKALVALGKEK